MQLYEPSNIIGRAEKDLYNTEKFTGKSQLDKEDFLTLLVVQMQNQDPLNPMDDKEFTAELAQFSSLEQLTQINEGVAALGETTVHQEMVNAASYIGKTIRAVGDNLSIHEDGTVSTMYYKLADKAEKVYMNIFDENGNIVSTVELGAQAAGDHEFQWDGKDWKGRDLPEGVYYLAMAAEGEDGSAILTQTEVAGVVTAVQYSGGVTYLRLSDGRTVAFQYVKEVVAPSTGSGGETGDTGDTGEETGDDTGDTGDDTGDTGDE
jgi:flagellar basal-body rod modification protein FlgD